MDLDIEIAKVLLVRDSANTGNTAREADQCPGRSLGVSRTQREGRTARPSAVLSL